MPWVCVVSTTTGFSVASFFCVVASVAWTVASVVVVTVLVVVFVMVRTVGIIYKSLLSSRSKNAVNFNWISDRIFDPYFRSPSSPIVDYLGIPLQIHSKEHLE